MASDLDSQTAPEADPKSSNLGLAAEGEVRDLRETTKDERQDDPRMWLFVRRDLPMPAGKLAAQAGHGFATCLWRTARHDAEAADRYMSRGQGKIAVAVKSEAELIKVVAACTEAGLVATTVTDAGHTVFEAPTLTVGAVGPCLRDQLPKAVKRLRLFTTYDEAA